jgi:hypothetical protein
MIDEREIRYRIQFYHQDMRREKEQQRLRRLALSRSQPRIIWRGFELWRWLKWPFRHVAPKTTSPVVINPCGSTESHPI